MRKKLLLIVVLIFIIMTGFSSALLAQELVDYYRAEVLSVENIETDSHFAALEQQAVVRITSGPYQGREIEITNLYDSRRPQLNIMLKEGTGVILVAYRYDDQLRFHLQDLQRDRALFFLVVAFAIFLLLIGGYRGLKTILTLLLTIIIIIRVMLPLLMAGYSPVPVATALAVIIIILILLIIGGFNRKTLAAVIGTVAGVLVAGFLAYYAGIISNLTGFTSNEAQMLAAGDFDLDIRGLLFAGIIIGSLGAITDVGMSIASAAAQIKEANPSLNFYKLTRYSLNIGRDIMGTMANTLILAYVGGALHFLILLMKYEMNWLRLINTDFLATEVVRGLAGSTGLLIAIPVTAVAAGYLIAKDDN